MSDPAFASAPVDAIPLTDPAPRHSLLVRLTHWTTALCFLALLVTGIEILISHPRFYWGETGNVLTPSLFDIPIPASRPSVNTGYGYVLTDQNGWSRSLHFQAAWLVVFTGLLYGIAGLRSRHFRDNLLPRAFSWRDVATQIRTHLRFQKPSPSEAWSYNVLQRLSYLLVIFVLFPLIVWTGLAMSPGFTSAFPFTVTAFGGQQSARTIHFFLTLCLAGFFAIHVTMVIVAGFRDRMRAMITGRVRQEQP